jgi:dTDP-4-amino-4,6-dideoxygalactose transaminase
MCVANDQRLAESLSVLRVHGGKPKYYHSVIGGNFRLDALQAAVLIVKLAKLDGWTAARQANAARYDRLFAAAGLRQVQTPVVAKGVRHIFNQYVLRVERRDALRAFLTDKDVGTEIYYPVPLHMQKCFSSLGMRPEDCPESAKAAAEVLAVPIYPELTAAQQAHVVQCVTEFYGKA